MPRLLNKSRGVGLEEALARLLNERIKLHGLGSLREPLSTAHIRKWFTWRGYRPEMFAAIFCDYNERLCGFAWAWILEDRYLAQVNLQLDPSIPIADQYYWGRVLLSWSKYSLLELQGYRGGLVILRIGALDSLGEAYLQLLRTIAPCLAEHLNPSGYLMVSSQTSNQYSLPPTYRIREAKPHISEEDAVAIAEIFNDSFSAYEDYSTWNPSDVKTYYKELFNTRKAIVLIAEKEGEPIGVVEAYIYKSMTGKTIGYHSMLAVKRSHQGKGVGKALIMHSEAWLKASNVDKIVLDAEPEALGFYLKLGYKIHTIYYKSRTAIECLPETPIHGIISESTLTPLK